MQYFHACSLLLLSRTRKGHRWIDLIEDLRCGSGRCKRGQRRRICRLRRDSREGLGVCCRCRTGRGRRLFRAGSAKAQKERQNQQSFHSAPPKVWPSPSPPPVAHRLASVPLRSLNRCT
jgi:hypothetical protein